MYDNSPPMPDTPNPMSPGEYVYTHRGQTYIVDVPLAPAIYAAAMPTHIDHVIGKAQGKEVLEILERIKSIHAHQVLDPSSCDDPNCEYSRGELATQRYVLLERLYQINCVLAQMEHKRTQRNHGNARAKKGPSGSCMFILFVDVWYK